MNRVLVSWLGIWWKYMNWFCFLCLIRLVFLRMCRWLDRVGLLKLKCLFSLLVFSLLLLR